MSDGFIDASSNPAAANAAYEALLSDEDAPTSVVATDPPVIADYSGGPWRLPGGVYTESGAFSRDLEVRELNGRDESNIAKASGDPVKWTNTVLAAGIQTVGEYQRGSGVDVLGSMLVGDRDYAMLAISEATYGPVIVDTEAVCPHCDEEFNLVIKVSDIPVKEMANPEERTFTVPLRKGGKAHVRLPNGNDQAAYLDGQDVSTADRNSALLRRIVGAIEDADGNLEHMAGFESRVDLLGVVDRKAILDAVDERMPGPQYSRVEIEHSCGKKIAIPPIGLMSLFPGL